VIAAAEIEAARAVPRTDVVAARGTQPMRLRSGAKSRLSGLAVDLANAVILGTEFAGHQVRSSGAVVYIAARSGVRAGGGRHA
jgi:hypothetical protein